jgi:hypothetical protein
MELSLNFTPILIKLEMGKNQRTCLMSKEYIQKIPETTMRGDAREESYYKHLDMKKQHFTDSSKETLNQAHYQYVRYLGDKSHLLKDLDTGVLEIFFSNKHHHGWGIIWKNTSLEFARSIEQKQSEKLP